jgi:hypothetical protein
MTEPLFIKPKPDPVKLLDAEVSFGQDRSTNDLIIKRHQFIPDDFVSDLKSGKMDSRNKRSGEMQLMMSIPVSVIEDFKRLYNYDAMEEPMARTIKLLKALHMDAFITSDKQI